MSDLFAGFPDPKRSTLTIFVIGPGKGESQLVSLPDGKWMVVDCCMSGRTNLPKSLLHHFNVKRIDLLVVTHSHVDHLRGIPELLSDFDVQRVWRWAHAGTLDDVLPRLCGMLPRNRRLLALSGAVRAIDEFAERRANAVSDASTDTRPWPAGGDYTVHPLSPTPHEVHAYRKQFDRLFELKKGKPALSSEVLSFVGGARRLPMPGNGLSMALSIGWKARRIVLGGDVEVSGDPKRGWDGILSLLRDEGEEALVRDAAVVKLSHHGSSGAWSPAAWKLHSQARPVEVAIATPFAEGPRPPPHGQTLRNLSRQANQLLLTSTAKGCGRPTANGWVRSVQAIPARAGAGAGAVVVRETGSLEVYAAKKACFFVQRRMPR